MPARGRRDRGFSFIELLAYMAIAALLVLAAVPQFASYQVRAAVTNMQSDLRNAGAAMEAAYVDRGAYPAALPSFPRSPRVSLDLTTVTSTAFCVTGAVSGTSVRYAFDSARGGVLRGDCALAAGDGLDVRASYSWDGAPGASSSTMTIGDRKVRNLVAEPDFRNGTAAGASAWTLRWFGPGADGTATRVSADGPTDRDFLRKAWTTRGTGSQDIGASIRVPVEAGKTYTASADIRSSFPTAEGHLVEWRDASGALVSSSQVVTGPHHAANTWTRVSGAYTAPAGAGTMTFAWGPYPLTAPFTIPSVGDHLDFTKAMVIEGTDSLPYFDGDTVTPR